MSGKDPYGLPENSAGPSPGGNAPACRPLSADMFPALSQVFATVFDGYVGNASLPTDGLKARLVRNGLSWPLSGGLFSEGVLVGFVLTGLGEWDGKKTAYNAGTGLLPAFRGRGLAGKLYAWLMDRQRAAGLEACLLEVLEENKPALALYGQLGFRPSRRLVCRQLPTLGLTAARPLQAKIRLSLAESPAWAAYEAFWDSPPAFQNTSVAVARATPPETVVEAWEKGGLLGYIAFDPLAGKVSQLGVTQGRRGLGVGTALLQAAQGLAKKRLVFINVPAENTGLDLFLANRGFVQTFRQHEMWLPL